MTNVELPVYLYDVTNTDAPPRLVVSCRTAQAAQDLAVRLNELQRAGALAGAEEFTSAEPRVAKVTLDVADGESVRVQGYAVATAEVAKTLNEAKDTKDTADAKDAAQFDALQPLTPLTDVKP